jgi:hypothetical protein
LIDLANDQVRGQDLMELLADLFWCRLIKRRRYTEGEPQGKDAACESAEARLEQLRQGTRIFVLDGVRVTDDNGNLTGDTYDNVMGPPTTIDVGVIGSDCYDPVSKFWGCTNPCRSDRRRGGCCG